MVRWLTCNPCDLYTVSADTQSEKQLYIQCVNIFFFCDTRLQRLTFHLFSRGGFSSRSTSRFSSNIIQLLVLCWNHWILFSLRKREPLSENVENVGTSVLPLPWFFFFFFIFFNLLQLRLESVSGCSSEGMTDGGRILNSFKRNFYLMQCFSNGGIWP